MSKTIYVVNSASGVYEDYHCWNEKAFNSREEAEKYARELDILHRSRPQFVTDEFIEAYNYCYDNTPDWGEGPKFSDDKEAYFAWQEECAKRDSEYITSEMYKKGFYVTEQMLEQYEEWESNSYNDWHDCEVEELELV